MAKAQPLETAANGSPTPALAEFVAGCSYKNIPPRSFRTSSFVSWTHSAARCSARRCPGENHHFVYEGIGQRQRRAHLGRRQQRSTEHQRAAGQRHVDPQLRDGRSAPGRRDSPRIGSDTGNRHAGPSRRQRRRQRFLTAVTVGYEVGCRVGMTGGAAQLRRGFHPAQRRELLRREHRLPRCSTQSGKDGPCAGHCRHAGCGADGRSTCFDGETGIGFGVFYKLTI